MPKKKLLVHPNAHLDQAVLEEIVEKGFPLTDHVDVHIIPHASLYNQMAIVYVSPQVANLLRDADFSPGSNESESTQKS